MRIFLLFSILLTGFTSYAQFAKKITGPVQTRRGITLKEGDTLTLGRGSGYGGTFRYLKMGLEPEGAANDPLPTHYAGKSFPIKLFRESQTGQETKLYASLKAHTLYTTFANIEAAIDTKEIIAVNGQEIGKPRARPQSATESTLTASNKSGITKTAANSAIEDGMTLKPFSNDVDIKILSVAGNKSQQTVTVNFVLKTELPHQKIGLIKNLCNLTGREGKAYDGEGTEYNLKTTSLGTNTSGYYGTVDNKLPTSVPLKGSITFANILPKVSMLSFITFFMSSANYDGGEHCQGGNVEIRNAKIDWK